MTDENYKKETFGANNDEDSKSGEKRNEDVDLEMHEIVGFLDSFKYLETIFVTQAGDGLCGGAANEFILSNAQARVHLAMGDGTESHSETCQDSGDRDESIVDRSDVQAEANSANRDEQDKRTTLSFERNERAHCAYGVGTRAMYQGIFPCDLIERDVGYTDYNDDPQLMLKSVIGVLGGDIMDRDEEQDEDVNLGKHKVTGILGDFQHPETVFVIRAGDGLNWGAADEFIAGNQCSVQATGNVASHGGQNVRTTTNLGRNKWAHDAYGDEARDLHPGVFPSNLIERDVDRSDYNDDPHHRVKCVIDVSCGDIKEQDGEQNEEVYLEMPNASEILNSFEHPKMAFATRAGDGLDGGAADEFATNNQSSVQAEINFANYDGQDKRHQEDTNDPNDATPELNGDASLGERIEWSVSNRKRNKLAHSANGNGASGAGRGECPFGDTDCDIDHMDHGEPNTNGHEDMENKDIKDREDDVGYDRETIDSSPNRSMENMTSFIALEDRGEYSHKRDEASYYAADGGLWEAQRGACPFGFPDCDIDHPVPTRRHTGEYPDFDDDDYHGGSVSPTLQWRASPAADDSDDESIIDFNAMFDAADPYLYVTDDHVEGEQLAEEQQQQALEVQTWEAEEQNYFQSLNVEQTTTNGRTTDRHPDDIDRDQNQRARGRRRDMTRSRSPSRTTRKSGYLGVRVGEARHPGPSSKTRARTSATTPTSTTATTATATAGTTTSIPPATTARPTSTTTTMATPTTTPKPDIATTTTTMTTTVTTITTPPALTTTSTWCKTRRQRHQEAHILHGNGALIGLMGGQNQQIADIIPMLLQILALPEVDKAIKEAMQMAGSGGTSGMAASNSTPPPTRTVAHASRHKPDLDGKGNKDGKNMDKNGVPNNKDGKGKGMAAGSRPPTTRTIPKVTEGGRSDKQPAPAATDGFETAMTRSAKRRMRKQLRDQPNAVPSNGGINLGTAHSSSRSTWPPTTTTTPKPAQGP